MTRLSTASSSPSKVEQDLGDLVAGTDTIQQKQTDFGPTVTKVKASGADALWFGGYYAEGGLLAKQLKAGGWKGTFLSGDGVLDPGFIEGAGASAANGSILTCPCAPADATFTEKYKAISGGSDPGTYSTEGYDTLNVFLQAVAAGKSTRQDMLDWVNNYDANGITKHIKFDQSGELSEVAIYAYKVEGGKIVPGTQISGRVGRRPGLQCWQAPDFRRLLSRPEQADACSCLSTSSS